MKPARNDLVMHTDKMPMDYYAADELIFRLQPGSGKLPLVQMDALCLEARQLAQRIRHDYPDAAPSAIAAARGITIRQETWQSAGQMIYFAECSFRPPVITLNAWAIARAMQQALLIHAPLTESLLTEIIVAHELFHLLAKKPSTAMAEPAAHAFARELLQLPFSLLLCESLLKS